MISLSYVSASVQRMSQEQLLQLLDACQRVNKGLNVTGLLVYNGQGTFLQVLEGDEAVVETLYAKIKRDSRHTRVNCIGRKPIDKPDFPNWSMGFRSLDTESVKSIAGYSNFMETEDSVAFLSDNTSFGCNILSHFKNTSSAQVLF